METLVRAAGALACALALMLGPAAAGQPDPSQETGPLTVAAAVRIAQQNHGDVAVAEGNLEAAQQRVLQTRTGLLPSVVGELSYRGAGTTDLGGLFGRSLRGDAFQTDTGLQPGIGLRYTVWDGGQNRLHLRQARSGTDVAEAGLTAVKNNFTFIVSAAFLEQLRAQRLLDLRELQVNLAEEQLALVDARIRAGAEAVRNRALPLAELRNAQVERITTENQLRIAANSLRNAMGLPVGPALQLVEPALSADQAIPTLAELQLAAEQSRPEIVQSQSNLTIAEAGLDLARLGGQPIVTGLLGMNVNPGRGDAKADYSVGAAVTMPLWDAGLTRARQEEARAGYENAEARLEQVRKDVMAEVEQAYLNLINALQRVDASQLAVEAAQESLEAANARFAVGEGTILELVTAQLTFFSASNSAIQALYDVFLAQAQLDRAVGK